MNKNVAIIAVVAVALVGALAFALNGGLPDDTVNPNVDDIEYLDEEISESPDVGITASDILSDPDSYIGETVSVSAEVEEWLTPRAFVLDAAGVINDNLLVITNEPTFTYEDPELFGDSIWEVTGIVSQFTITVANDTLDLDLEPDIFTVYETKPFIIADSVTLIED